MSTENGFTKELRTETQYFPVWKTPAKLPATLTNLAEKVCRSERIDLLTVTMTAELSDAYKTKRQGVNQILSQVEETFPNTQILILDVNGKLRTVQEARSEPEKVAAANWFATGWLVSQFTKNCIAVDVGSTTTSLIPIIDGAVSAEGKNDMEKLVNGELVYTGSLRTNVATTIQTVPLRDVNVRVSSELFAQSADIHLVLGNISEGEYTVETADGKEKTREAALSRLARVICADTDMLSEKEIVQIAHAVYEKQIQQISEALTQVYNRVRNGKGELKVVVTGVGRNFLARKAALQSGLHGVIDFGQFFGNDVARASTAFALALMGASYLEGRSVRWMP